VHLFKENAFAILFDLIRCQDQYIPQILIKTLKQLIFKIGQGGFEQEVLPLVGLFI
jgi:hypothetical protein